MEYELNKLLVSSIPDITSPGVCNTAEWFAAVNDVHQLPDVVEINAVDNSGAVCFVGFVEKEYRFLPFKTLHQGCWKYSTRSSVAIRLAAPVESMDVFLDNLQSLQGWHKSRLLLVDNSIAQNQLVASLNKNGLRHQIEQVIQSPYICLPSSLDEYTARFDKKFRYTLRNGLKKLSEQGKVQARLYETPERCAEMLEHIYEIEKNSWKEQDGTSITKNPIQKAFYEKFSEVAAQQGWLKTFILFVDEQPVAHCYGMLFNGVFENLKMSYKSEFNAYSPGNLLNLEIIKYLIAHNVTVYDYMGVVEPSKMKWTNDIYSQSQVTFYRKSLSGRLFYYFDLFKSWFKKRFSK
ncbi:GNAT family N-acetyltransferase [Bowmanella yangjiangensis]|uniref:GNAT family N-acetyltransferase n=1 Tax=Bowmanella yangjiangensis TaxID=2811230 RepID=A0ABS3CTD4_9ALTE|nr:GNAT family N-acetyltransferase [Bowmanella yangjiangensis]